ncbi:nicotinamidase-related amidase [Rhizobium sp. BIGb0125]|uniref:cysteine hydrolase family protein n=1 Tax=Rhizobium sp. BIGb0125 TaxID=2940618 RepID=UPI0021695559|nr:cysteine hydrolase family protein [Rhizobium sp. BIGb0125]MCS4242604.1 nicotinamidase-related amidase [Rhizobium sp. BIGb0125]
MAKTALIIIDMQMDMQQRIDAGRDHVNGEAPEKITALATTFRAKNLPVLHIRHAESNPASPFNPGAPGYQPMPCGKEVDGEPIFVKNTSSGFASTDLAEYLRSNGIEDLVVTGAVAGFCVNSTVRAGADLGFNMTVVRDAVLGFDLPSANLSAQTIFDVTMAHLEADFARFVDAETLLAG